MSSTRLERLICMKTKEQPCDPPVKYIKVHMAIRWIIRHGLVLLWFKDLMNATYEVTIHRSNLSTLTVQCLHQVGRSVGGVNMLEFQTKALANYWLQFQTYPTQLYGQSGMCAPIKLNFLFCKTKSRFQTCIRCYSPCKEQNKWCRFVVLS